MREKKTEVIFDLYLLSEQNSAKKWSQSINERNTAKKYFIHMQSLKFYRSTIYHYIYYILGLTISSYNKIE